MYVTDIGLSRFPHGVLVLVSCKTNTRSLCVWRLIRPASVAPIGGDVKIAYQNALGQANPAEFNKPITAFGCEVVDAFCVEKTMAFYYLTHINIHLHT